LKSLQTPWPTGPPSELLYTPFWATVGYGLPEVIGCQLGLNISESGCVALGRVLILDYQHISKTVAFCRNTEDTSITVPDKRRDYVQHLDNVMVVGGEDKPQRHLMRQAVRDLLDKHKGANPALYGDLGYLILLATAADAVSVFALQLQPNARLEPLMRHATITKYALTSVNYTEFCLTATQV